jgi:predicted amidohydrolase YtcJ
MNDQVFLNATIVSPNFPEPFFGAFAVSNNRFSAVGSNESVLDVVGNAATVTDLRGKIVSPGIVDSHSHFPDIAVHELCRVTLYAPPRGPIGSIDALVNALSTRAQATRPGDWIIGYGYEIGALSEGRHPNRFDLDKVSDKHPVGVLDLTTHFVCLNSLGLQRCHIDGATVAPAGGEIDFGADGAPTGLLKEMAVYLFAKHMPSVQKDDFMQAVRMASTSYLRHGYTTAQVGHLGSREMFDYLREAVADGSTPLRLVVWPSYKLTLDLISEFGDLRSLETERFRIGATKLFCDGEIHGGTAFLTEPYVECPGCTLAKASGLSLTSAKELHATLSHLRSLNRQYAIHAAGDAAIDLILEVERELGGHQTQRNILVHALLARKDQLEAALVLGLTPSFFPLVNYYWGDLYSEKQLGAARVARLNPLMSAFGLGHKLTIHTDAPVTPCDTVELLRSAVVRETMSGQILGPEEAISPTDALNAMTGNAAWQSFMESAVGSIEVGKMADFLVWDGDPQNPAQIRDRSVKIAETFISGVRCYQDEKA